MPAASVASPIAERIASAPISWGVCEVPGWGLMMDPRRVLGEMVGLGLAETELGSPGFFPDDPADVKAMLDEFGVGLIGGFVPLALHDAGGRKAMFADAVAWARRLETAGGRYFITAAITDADWSPRGPMTDAELEHFCVTIDAVGAIAADHGLVQVLHPHANTMVETATDVRRVLAASDVLWCLDTGHLAIGGCDPVAFAREHADRVGLVHLKDIDRGIASRFMAGEFSLMGAVQQGMFRPLGQGEAHIAEVVAHLESAGYQGRYIIEQDQAIDRIPELGSGPVDDVRVSVDYLRSLSATR